ncbi:hypothetical protein NE237_009485 [Protea cynaroides]|uniref:pyruvate decarboxylase n=1 Tax=Protea cynaroides TaxID=273540 RepID=A0A9Q0R0T1_9MAGN|nr:hypothetical protein NE237_009485 [Protea cynaroides]
METRISTMDSRKPASNNVCSLPSSGVSVVQNSVAPSLIASSEATLGCHLARRLVEIGATDVFSVPGDFSLILLDHLIAEPGLNIIGCCNELNAGYAADGFARSRGIGVCVVTFTVGGLSVINAIAGAYSESLPVICIVGGPNSNDYGTNRILHHTIGLPDFSQELRCFHAVTCDQAVVSNVEDAHELINTAISTALKESKPVYISISCNLSAIPHPTFSRQPRDLEAAVDATIEFLHKVVKPVMVGGPKLRVAKAYEAFVELADACGYAVAAMPSAKGLVPENHPRFISIYWGGVSTAFCAGIVESADAYTFAGSIFNDYSSVGYSLLLKKEKAIIVQPDRVVIPMDLRLGVSNATQLLMRTTAVSMSLMAFPKCEPNEPLWVNVLFKHIQAMLSSDTALIVVSGDSWFNSQKLKLPEGCGYEFQMQYRSIGWSVGATLGYAQAAKDKRVIACIGDGSFKINWNYTALVDAIHNGEEKCWTTKSNNNTCGAIETATGSKEDSLCFIEVIVHKEDTSKDLLKRGSRVSAANGRPPNPFVDSSLQFLNELYYAAFFN